MDRTSLPVELLVMFREEVRDNVQLISNALREIEAGAAAERVSVLSQDIGRRLHNVKGAASSLGLEPIASVAHAAETLLLADAGGASLSADTMAGMLYAISWLQDATAQEDPDPGPVLARLSTAPSRSPGPSRVDIDLLERTPTSGRPAWDEEADHGSTSFGGMTAGEDVVRVSATLLEQVLSPLTALVSERTESRYRAERLHELSDVASGLARRAASAPLHAEDLARLRELATDLARESERLRDGTRRAGQAISTLEDHIQGMRLVSLNALGGALSLAARDAAMRTQKTVDFTVEASGVQVDRRVLEALRAPLIHLVRNAVDHGIESPSARKAAGKPPKGQLKVRVTPRGELVDILIEDDGAGVDVARVAKVAKERGLIALDRDDRLGTDDVLALLSHPGFSTRKNADELSGRGIGMDVVAKVVRELGGSVVLDSAPGRGTSFTLTIPVSVLTTRVLFVRVDGRVWALPLAGVDGTLRLSEANVYTLDGKLCVDVGGTPALVRQLGGAQIVWKGTKSPAVALGNGKGKVALVVDEILGEEEVVVRPLGPPVRHVRGVVGTTFADSGAVVVVLSPSQVASPDFAFAGVEPARRVEMRTATLLVVDDSLTTRTLERHILERAGYVVRLASDGQEALGVLRAERCDLVVADVEMPRLDGIGLVRAMRADPALEATPLILVTSLDSESDRRRGLTAGANAYVVKGRFDQEKLLETVRELLEGKG